MSTSQHADPLIGRLVDGRYRVRARIARGGMATVYVATDLRLERRIALKVMHGHLSDDTVFQSRFIQEARAAARLADPHVVNVFDQGQDGDMAYLVMEYLPGITLRELLREQRRLTVPQTVTIMDAILSGLAAAHRAGIVHRDVKPENVLLAEDGRIKIGDFGLARATTANTATGAQLLGTIAYLAPELVTRGMADARSDIYSLGIMLYEMLVGEQPYKGEQPMQIAFQHATDSVPRPSVKNPGVPEQLDELVLWATEKSSDDRPTDASVMLERLREIERELGIAPQVARTLSAGIIREEVVGDSGDLTQVMPAAMTGPTTTVEEIDNATRLRAITKRRSAKGAWLLVIVILLAGLAGGAGWWFGSGPGSQVAVPDVSAMDFAQAQQRLAEDSFQGVQQDVFDIDVAPGIVVGTDPVAGSRLDQNASITVLVSKGPESHEVQALNGSTAADARGILLALDLRVADPDDEYFTDAAAETVIGVSVTPRAGGDAIDCTEGCTALEGDTATLSVSVGPLPDVFGESVDSATARLNDQNVQVSGTYEEFRDDLAAGLVIYIARSEGDGDVRPGDSVDLAVSKGPEPIEVPDVTGESINDAIEELQEEGFEVRVDGVLEIFWDVYRVTSINPGAGELAPRGSVVNITGFGL